MAIGIAMGVMMLVMCIGGHVWMHKKHKKPQASAAVQVSTATVRGSTGTAMDHAGEEHSH